MAINASLSTIKGLCGTQRISSPLPQFKVSPTLSNPPLLHKINWVFGFYVAYLAAGVSYCLYNLYQAYQLRHHTSFGLGDGFKLAKCQALLDEARKKNFKNAQPLLLQCEALLASCADTTYLYDGESFLVKIAQYYTQHNPERSYEMALSFSSSHELLKVARNIQKNHPDFDKGKLSVLFIRAYEARNQEAQQPILLMKWYEVLEFAKIFDSLMKWYEVLEFAKIFHSLKLFQLSNQCMTEALELANAEAKDLTRFNGLCQIARCYQEIGNLGQMRTSIESAQALLNDKIVGIDLIESRLNLASIFFSLKDFSRMDQELTEVVSLIEKNNPVATVKNLYVLAEFLSTLRKSKVDESTFTNFEVESLIEKALIALGENKQSSLSAEDRVDAYLKIASIYQENLLIHSVENNKALGEAVKEIQNLPEDTDEAINSKIELLMYLRHFYKKDVDSMRMIIQSLENLYDRRPVDDDFQCEKAILGKRILHLYNEIGMKEQSDIFFQKYLSHQTNQKDTEISKKFNRLVVGARRLDDHDNVEQLRAQLEAAQALLPQLTSSISHDYALSMIIRGYLQIDQNKGLDLLENYENQQAKKHLITAAAIPIIMGLVYLYPNTAPLISAEYSLLRFWQGQPF